MAQRPVPITIEITQPIYRVYEVNQNDSLLLDIDIVENGLAKVLTGETVQILYVNANNTLASVAGGTVVVNGNNVVIALPNDCTRSAGYAHFQLVISKDGLQESSFPIDLQVKQGVVDGQAVSTNLATMTEELIAKNNEALETNALLETNISNGNIPLIRSDLNTAMSDLVDIATDIKTQSDIVNAIALAIPLTLNIGRVVNITSDLTIPNNITLKFNNNGMFNISSGVILTLNCQIDAIEKQIFNFADATSILTTSSLMPNSDFFVKQKTFAQFKIKLSWFGAKGDASIFYNPSGAFDVTGTDDTIAIKRAMSFADKMSVVLPNMGSYCFVTIEAKPNAMYLVQGDNILGVQNTTITNGGYGFKFVGNGCTFYHKPLLSTDSFIGNGRKFNRPNYSDFGIFVIGDYIVGTKMRKGYFFNTNGGDVMNTVIQGNFKNVTITSAGTNWGYDVLFKMDGDNMGDNFYIEHCVFTYFNKVVNNTNDQAVNWLFKKCQMASFTDGAIYFDYITPNSGGANFENLEINILNDNETILKVEGVMWGEPVFNLTGCRIEVQSAKHTLFDVSNGVYNVRDINTSYGFSGIITSESITAKIGKDAYMNFENCVLSENFTIECFAQTYTYTGVATGLKTSNCLFTYGASLGKAYPTIKFKKPDSTLFLQGDILKTDYVHKSIQILNPSCGSYTDFTCLPIVYDCHKRQENKVEIYQRNALGKLTMPFTTPTRTHYILLPSYCVISSLKIHIKNINLAVCNKILMGIASIAPITVDLTTYVSGTELLNGKFASIPLNGALFIGYGLTNNSDYIENISQIPDGYLEITYKPMNCSYEYNESIGAFINSY